MTERDGTAVVVDLKAEVLECVSGSLETVCLIAEAVTLAADVGDKPSTTEAGLGLARNGRSLPHKNGSCW